MRRGEKSKREMETGDGERMIIPRVIALERDTRSPLRIPSASCCVLGFGTKVEYVLSSDGQEDMRGDETEDVF